MYRLHDLLAKALLNRLERDSDEKCETCGRDKVSIADLTAIRQFLSDNGVTGPAATAPSPTPMTEDLPHFDNELA